MIDARNHYELMYRNSGGLTARARLVAFVNTHAAPLLSGKYSDGTGRQLHRAVGGLLALAGICSYDSERHGEAQRYFRHALWFAESSGDHGFGGYVHALMANQALALGDYRRAVDFTEAALRFVGKGVSPALMADLNVMQAKAYALMGDSPSAYSAMTEAESSASRIRRSEEPPETSYIQPGLVETQLAEALIDLGDLEPARRYAQESLRIDAHPRGRVNRLASMVSLELRDGNIDHASTLAIDMVNRAQGMESCRLRDRFRRIRIVLNRTPIGIAAEAVETIDRTLRLSPW
ncbi:MAG: hypothetical protein ACRDQ5_17485 [Sciscionella sp.]